MMNEGRHTPKLPKKKKKCPLHQKHGCTEVDIPCSARWSRGQEKHWHLPRHVALFEDFLIRGDKVAVSAAGGILPDDPNSVSKTLPTLLLHNRRPCFPNDGALLGRKHKDPVGLGGAN